MNITNELINEIRNKIDIVEIISNYVPLTQRGKNYFGVCPFHDDSNPSMCVSREKQIYTCFSYTYTSLFKYIYIVCLSFIISYFHLKRKSFYGIITPKSCYFIVIKE